jgi:ribosomal protein L40E
MKANTQEGMNMSDFLSGLGGIIKGMQPLMGEEAKKDASMNAFLIQTDLNELEKKKQGVLARIGAAVLEARSGGKYPEFSELCEEAAEVEKLIGRKRAEAEEAKRAAEDAKRAEQYEADARTCKSCGAENPPGTKFCQECGEKLIAPVSSKCPSCGAENPPGTKFCRDCGAKLGAAATPKCPGCGAENPPGTKFCRDCGTKL